MRLQTRTLAEATVDARDFSEMLRLIRADRKSGVLTINFSQGSPCGAMKWTEPAKGD